MKNKINTDEYKSSLDIISFNDEEIEIINKLFGGLIPSLKRIKLNQITYTPENEGKRYLIDAGTKFKFHCIWDDDPYEYYISRPVFNDEKTVASIYWGWYGSALDGRGYITHFVKKKNKWKKFIKETEWVS